MARLRVALMGAGAMGTIMAQDIYPQLTDTVEVVAVIDQIPVRAERLAQGLGAQPFGTLDQALRAVRLDAVDIRVPHAEHAAATCEALGLGLHVLVDKPMATSLEECESMQRAGQIAGTVVAVAENYPHLKSVQAAQAALAQDTIGDVVALGSRRVYRLEGAWASAWRQDSGPTGGILWDQGTHHTSMLRALAGEVESVAAASSANHDLGIEVVTLTLLFRAGLVAQSLYCWGSPAVPLETEATVFGSTGRIDITVDYEGESGRAVLRGANADDAISPSEGYYDSHRLIVEDWVDAITRGTRPLVGLQQATEDVRVVLAARQSLAQGGLPVTVNG